MRKNVLVGILMLIAGLALWTPARAEEGVTDTEIVIGSHVDMSGPAAKLGIDLKTGLEMKAREINEAGGIHGRKIKMVIEDNGYDPKKAIMATNKLINLDKVFCFTVNFGSATAGATKPIISGKRIPQVWPIAPASIFYEPYDRYSFGGGLPYNDALRCLVKYFVDKNVKKFGILYQDDEMGTIQVKAAKEQLAVYNLNFAAEESYKRGATDFSSQIAKLKRSDVQLVILGTTPRETFGALKEAKAIGWNVDMAGSVGTYFQQVIDLLGDAGLSGEGFRCLGALEYPYPDSPRPPVRAWQKRHQDWYGKPAVMGTAIAYLGLHFTTRAIQMVGRDLTREKMVDALETFREVQDGIFDYSPITFTKDSHQGPFGGYMFQVQEGKFKRVSDLLTYQK
jgi:branched-chain amino acid transport system substrate-binding protein